MAAQDACEALVIKQHMMYIYIYILVWLAVEGELENEPIICTVGVQWQSSRIIKYWVTFHRKVRKCVYNSTKSLHNTGYNTRQYGILVVTAKITCSYI